MTKDEALKLALEALECIKRDFDADQFEWGIADEAITVIKEALAQPEQIMQDSTCSTTLRLQGKPYPRTCKKCGLGPCIAQPSAQPEQEPVALEEKFSLLLWDYQELERAFEKVTGGKWVRKSNTPQRIWVGLTHEEIDYQARKDDHAIYFALGALWAEAKLKEKNNV